MITKQQIKAMFQNDVDSTREWRKQYKADYAQIEIVFNETRENGPRKTVETLIERLGYDRAEAVIATMINSIGEWDGRIDERNRAWAKTIDEAFDKEAAQDAFIFCSIHSCHANQIASEMRRTERPVEPVEAEEDEPVETISEDAAEATETVTETADATEDESVEAEAEDATETATEGHGAMIDDDLILDYINHSCSDPDSLGTYDYREAMKIDIAQHIRNEITVDDLVGEDESSFIEKLNEDLWADDSVTGNGSGSYTFNTAKAAENVQGNEDLVREMIREFGYDAGEIVDRFLNAEWEWFDVSIRCYLLGEMISTVVRDLVELGAIQFAA